MSRAAWMTRAVPLAVNALAAYRLTRLWTRDTLPPLPLIRERITDWAEFNWWPNRVIREDGPQGVSGTYEGDHRELAEARDMQARYHGKPPLVNLVDCPWCVGFWAAVGVVAAATAAPRVWTPVATALALSAVVGLLSEHDSQGA